MNIIIQNESGGEVIWLVVEHNYFTLCVCFKVRTYDLDAPSHDRNLYIIEN